MRLFVLLFALALSAVADATPVQITVQSRVLGADGAPVTALSSVTVGLYPTPTGSPFAFEETFTNQSMVNGYVSLVLGADTEGHPLQHTVLDQDPLYVQLTVDGAVQVPRQRLASVPRAISVHGGTVDVATVSVAGGLRLGLVSSCATEPDGTLFFDGSAVKVCIDGDVEALGNGVVGIGIAEGVRRWDDGSYAASCQAYRSPVGGYAFQGINATSGLYAVDPDGDGLAPVDVYCDMATDGGGWQLFLAYDHAGGVTTAAADNGAPQSPTGSYTHSYLGAMGYGSANVASQMRLYCQTSLHGRVIHFRTSNGTAIADMFDGVGSTTVSDWTSGFTTYPDHTANLPASANSSYSGTRAHIDFPFYRSGAHHWSVGGSGRWECDGHPDNASNTTRHQIWWR